MTHSDDLWATLEENPEDTHLKLVLCDLLTEEGKEEEALTIRWCVENRRWPVNQDVLDHSNTNGVNYGWWRDWDYDDPRLVWKLKANLFALLPHSRYPRSSREAVHQLAAALKKVGELVPV